MQEVDNGADHPCFTAALGVHRRQCVHAILGLEGITHRDVSIAHPHAQDSPGWIGFEDAVHVNGLMRPVETAHTEVDDTYTHVAPVVAGKD